jgi:outer membrane protein
MHNPYPIASIVLSALVLTLFVGTAQAAGGDWLIRAGAHQVDPKSNNHPVVGVRSDESFTLSGTYFFTDHIAIELLGAYPFTHDITLNADGSEVGQTTHLPPTLSLQYHFLPDAAFRPYVGAGLNYTFFYDEETRGALEGTTLSLDNSFGLAAEVGIDIAFNEDWALNLNIRWFDIDTDARLNGDDLGTVEVDPFAYGLMFTRKLRF